MAFKFVVALAFVAVASAGYLPAQQVYQAGPVAHTVAVAQPVLAKQVEEYDPHPQYKYSYDVQDAITGDVKSQTETRDGDVVQGEYSLIDADGYKRIVQYTADAVHGFNAVVTRVPLNVAVKTVAAVPAVVKAAPVAYAAPALLKTVSYAAPSYYKSAPVAYAAPAVVKTVAPVAYAAPSYYKSAPVAYAAPAVVKTVAPVAYAAPSYYKSAPVAYAAPAVVKTVAPVAYAAPSYYKSAPVAYAAPAVVKTVAPVADAAPGYYKAAPAVVKAPVSYATSESYTAPAYVRSAPVNYGYNH